MVEKLGEAYLELTAKNANLKGKLEESEDASKGFISRTQSALNKFGKVAFVGAIAGFTALTAVIIKATQAAAAEQLQTAQLAHQLRRLGLESETAMREVDALANKQQELTRFGDTQTRATLAQLIMLTNDYQGSMKNLNLVYDIAESGMFDVRTAARYVGMAMQGNVEILGRYIPELRASSNEALKNMTANEKAAYAIDLLRSKFGGLAEEMGKTVAGSWAKMKNAASDALEAFGYGMLEPTREGLNDITTVLKDNEDSLKDLGKAVATIGTFAIKNFGIFVQMIEDATATVRKLIDIEDYRAAQEARLAIADLEWWRRKNEAALAAIKEEEAAERRAEERRRQHRQRALEEHAKWLQDQKDLEIDYLRATGNEILAKQKEIEKWREESLKKYENNAAARVMVEKIAQEKIKKLHQNAAADIIDIRKTLNQALERMGQLETGRMGMLRGRITAPLTAGGMRLAGGEAAPGVTSALKQVFWLEKISGTLEEIKDTREPAVAGSH